MNRTLAASLAAFIAITLSACGEPAGRTGTGPDPVTLKAPEAASDTLFGRLATDTSAAAVRITLAGSADDDTVTLARLRTGAFDLAVVRAGRLEEAGADSLAPLGAPFLVTNDDQARAIAADPRAETLYAGLPDLGLVGIGLVPVGVRHPFGYTTALRGAADYAGKTINNRVDATSTKILTALGANVDHSGGDERTSKVKAGALRGIEASLQVLGVVDLPAVLTSNVDLYARFDVVVVRKPTWDALTARQRDALQAAVTRANAASLAVARTEVAAMAEWCALGGSSVAATDAELATLHTKLDPLVEEIAAKHATTIDWMRALRQGTSDPELRCADDASGPPTWAVLDPVGDQGLLDGAWRIANTRVALEAGGLTPSDALNNAGVWELDIQDGKALVTVPNGRVCHWTFTIAGERVLLDLGRDSSCIGQILGTYQRVGDTVTFRWAKGADGVDPDAVYLGKLYNVLFGRMVKVQGG